MYRTQDMEYLVEALCYKPTCGEGRTHTKTVYWLVLRRKSGGSDTLYGGLPITGKTGRE
jgi:hypothetical protein